jgi:hypothetical protein
VREREEKENETNKQERRSCYLIKIIFPQVPNDERHNMSLQRTLLLLLFPASSYHSHRPPSPTAPWSLVLFSPFVLFSSPSFVLFFSSLATKSKE